MDIRIRVIFIIFCAWFIIMAARLWDMQVLHQKKYMDMSVRNRTRFVQFPSARGRIYDRNGVLLADNKPATELVVINDEVRNAKILAEDVSSLTKLSPQYILKKIKENMYRPFVPAVLASDLSDDTLVKIAEAKYRLPGISLQVAPVRDYLLGEQCAHLIGYVGEVSRYELNNSGYAWGDIVGRIGIEKQYDKKLHGEEGYKEIQVDFKGYMDSVLNFVEPKTGTSLYLTIDSTLQEELYNALKAHKGAGIVMNPQNGEILSLVSTPSFDPNLLVSPVKQDVAESIFMNKSRPMLNRAISGLYPPGSIFKIIIALTALESETIDKKSLFFCDGEFKLGDSIFRCWEKKGHGWVDLSNALKKSCNEFFYQVGIKLNAGDIVNMSKRFGLGKCTGIDIPNEKEGFLPTRDIEQSKWFSGDSVNLSIGHGKILVTPIQITCLISAVANGGILYKPKLLINETVQGSEINIDKKYIDIVKEGLFRVINEPDGTGHKVFINGLDIAGKTGTVELTENRKKRDICWFAGFCPYLNPEIAVVIVTEEGESGGATAGPVAQAVLKKWQEKYKPQNTENLN